MENKKPKLKPRGKSRKFTEAQIDEAAKPDLTGADRLAKRLGGNVRLLWNAGKEEE